MCLLVSAAAQMGLPIERLIVASNQNDILPRFFEAGRMARNVVPSLSPSMDIQVSSNFERLLFELTGARWRKDKVDYGRVCSKWSIHS